MPETFSRDDLVAILGEEDGELLGELQGIFEAESVRLVSEVVDGAGRGDHAAVARAAHMLKSAAGNLGGRAARELAMEIEAAARHGDAARLAPLTARLPPEIDALRSALAGFVSTLRARASLP